VRATSSIPPVSFSANSFTTASRSASPLQLVLEVDGLAHRQVHDRCITALPRPELLSKRDAPQRHTGVTNGTRGRLRRLVSWRIGVLGTVAEHDHTGKLTTGTSPHSLGNCRTDRCLVGGLAGLPGGERKRIAWCRGQGTQFAIERIGGDVEIAALHQGLGSRPCRRQCCSQRIPAGLAVGTVRHGHALRGIGEHHHGALLPRLPSRDEGRPQHAEHERKKRTEPQKHEQ
jgi:hypothetical protein